MNLNFYMIGFMLELRSKSNGKFRPISCIETEYLNPMSLINS